MGQVGDKLRLILKEKKIRIKDFAKAIDLSEPAVYVMLRTDNYKLKTMEKITKFLNIEISVFSPIVKYADPEKNVFLSKDESQKNAAINKYIYTVGEKLLEQIEKTTGVYDIRKPHHDAMSLVEIVGEILVDDDGGIEYIHGEVLDNVIELLREGRSKEQVIDQLTPSLKSSYKKMEKFKEPLIKLNQSLKEFIKEIEKIEKVKYFGVPK